MNSSFGIDQWIQIGGTIGVWLAVLVAVILALWGQAWQKRFIHPNLYFEMPGRYPVKTKFGSPPTIDVHYLHIRVRNNGNELAEDVELFVERIEAVQQDGSSRLIGVDNPTNLPVSLGGGAISRTIHSDFGAYFDIGHITDPNMRPALNALEAKANVPAGETCFVMEYSIQPNIGDHILPQGTYRLSLAAVAKNANPCRRRVQLTVSGRWFPDEENMKRDGVGLEIL